MSFLNDTKATRRLKAMIEHKSDVRGDVVTVIREMVKRQRGDVFTAILDDLQWFDVLRFDEIEMFRVFQDHLSLETRGTLLKYVFLQSPEVAKRVASNDELYERRAIDKKEFVFIVNTETGIGYNNAIELVDLALTGQFEQFVSGEEKIAYKILIRPLNVTEDEWRAFDANVNKYRAMLYGKEEVKNEKELYTVTPVDSSKNIVESESDDHLIEQLLATKKGELKKTLEE